MKIKIMQCLWNKSLEGRVLDVDKVTSKQPTIKVLINKIANIENILVRIIDRLDKIEQRMDMLEQRMDRLEQRLDNIVKLNNLRE